MQPVVHRGLAVSTLFQPHRDILLGLGDGPSVEIPGVHHHTVPHISLGERRAGIITLARHDPHDGQLHGFGEVEITLVVTGDRHDRPGPVLHEYVVGDPDGNRLTGGRVPAEAASRNARFGLLDLLASHEIFGRRLLPVGRDRLRMLLTSDFVHQGVLG